MRQTYLNTLTLHDKADGVIITCEPYTDLFDLDDEGLIFDSGALPQSFYFPAIEEDQLAEAELYLRKLGFSKFIKIPNTEKKPCVDCPDK